MDGITLFKVGLAVLASQKLARDCFKWSTGYLPGLLDFCRAGARHSLLN
jgi:hypothetical protein